MVAPKMGNSNDITGADAINQKVSVACESQIHNVIVVPKVGNAFEIDKGRVHTVCNSDFCRRDLIGFTGVVSHSILSSVATR